jgi:hypothetical protein
VIQSPAEYEGAQRELRSLKEFLSRMESAPDHPDKALGLISIYKKLYHLWEELEQYYRACLEAPGTWDPVDAPTEPLPRVPSVPSASGRS